MNFNLNLGVDQVNMIIKGLEMLRDASSNMVQDVMRQVQAQVAANTPQPPVAPEQPPVEIVNSEEPAPVAE